MIPRQEFTRGDSPYVVDEAVYRRFDARNTAFVRVGLQDSGEVAPNNWLNTLQMIRNERIKHGY